MKSRAGRLCCVVLLFTACTLGRPPAVAAQSVVYRTFGLDFSPYVDGQDPNAGSIVGEDQLRARLQLVAPYTIWVRAFGSSHGLEKTGRIGHELGLKVACSAWLGRNATANEQEINALILSAQHGDCDMAIVGSEVLLRNDLTESALLSFLARVRDAIPVTVPVSTADVHGQLLAHPNVLNAVDVVLVNYYPYWEGVVLKHAMASLHRQHQQVVAAAGGKPIIVSETGWPTCGNKVGAAVPSPTNAASYFLNFVSWARANAVPYFYFSALDESWKASYEGPQGACWGVFDKNGTIKTGMGKVFSGKRKTDNWSGLVAPGGAGTAAIEFTTVPKYNTFKNLKGRMAHVAPANHRVAVYIKVGGGWWTKPTFAQPTTSIWPDGTWECDITTGGSDQLATEIAAFLVPASYAPPLVGGASALPAELDANAVAKTSVMRAPR